MSTLTESNAVGRSMSTTTISDAPSVAIAPRRPGPSWTDLFRAKISCLPDLPRKIEAQSTAHCVWGHVASFDFSPVPSD